MNKINLLEILNKKYPKLKFGFKQNECFEFYLLYKVVNPIDYNEFATREFIDELDNSCEQYLSDEELEGLAIVYDYLDEI